MLWHYASTQALSADVDIKQLFNVAVDCKVAGVTFRQSCDECCGHIYIYTFTPNLSLQQLAQLTLLMDSEGLVHTDRLDPWIRGAQVVVGPKTGFDTNGFAA